MATSKPHSRDEDTKRIRQQIAVVGRASINNDPEAVADARRDLQALKIEQAIQRALEKAPRALTPAQVRRLTALLRTSGGVK